MKIKFFTAGGTIDKVYFDRKSEYQVGKSHLVEILEQAQVTVAYEYESLFRKDSLDLTEDDRQVIYEKIRADQNRHIIVTHGTDTMIETARRIKGIPGKIIVLTGAMAPASFKGTDADFNIGLAVAAVQVMPPGVYIAMNGRIYDPDKVRKNIDLNRFEDI